MECLKCGATVKEENAVYCCACGARLDGKKACPACGEFIDEKYTYCVYCGARVDGKTACPNCSSYHTGAFCPDCGTALQPKKPAQKAAKAKLAPESKNAVWEKIFAWIRSGAGIACTLFALIFVFLIGYTMKVTGSESLVESLGATGESKNLFHYFGDVYKDIADIKDSGMFESSIPVTAAYIYAILGTAISALTILGVVGFAIPAVIGFVKFAIRGEENNGAKWGVRSALVFLGGAAAMYTLDVMSMKLAYAGEECATKIAYNGATKAGIILCIIFLAVYAIGNLVRKGKEWKCGKTIAFYALTVCAAVFAIVVLAVDKGGFVGSKIIVAGETLLSGTFSQFYNNTMLVSMSELTAGAEFYNEHLATISTSFAFSIVQQALLIATVVCAVMLIGKYAFDTEDKKSATWLSICLVIFTVVQLICGIVCQSSFHSLIVEMAGAGDSLKCKLQLGKAIVAVVFALLNLGVQIARNAVAKKTAEEIA